VTLPLALIPAFNNMGWNIANNLHNQRIMAIVTLCVNHGDEHLRRSPRRDRQQHRLLFEILAWSVFAFILALFHHHQGASVIFHTGGTSLTTGTFLVAISCRSS